MSTSCRWKKESLLSPFYSPTHQASPALPPSLRRLDPGSNLTSARLQLACPAASQPRGAPLANTGAPAQPCRALMKTVPPQCGLTSPQNPPAPNPAWGNLLELSRSHIPPCLQHPFMLLPTLPSPHPRKPRPDCENVLPAHPNPWSQPENLSKPTLLFAKDRPRPVPSRPAAPLLCAGDAGGGEKGTRTNSILGTEPVGLVRERDVRMRVMGDSMCPPGNSNSMCPQIELVLDAQVSYPLRSTNSKAPTKSELVTFPPKLSLPPPPALFPSSPSAPHPRRRDQHPPSFVA